jgi:para-nitrobenzyl esterase
MKKILPLMAIACFTALLARTQCDNGRYRDLIFPNVDMQIDVPYGSNLAHNGVVTELLLDVFEPAGDAELMRPLVILAHGGFFVGGSKEGLDVAPACNDLARMGYVTASINYRLGFPSTLNLAGPMTEAVMRGVQDMKAAVRFFRMTVDEMGNPYRIDPNQIFIGGFSAGGFISLHYAYLQDDEIPANVNQNANGLAGGVEGQSGNEGYSTEVNAIMNIAGALGDTLWIESGDLPALLAHGSSDTVVPFDSDMLVISGFLEVSQVDGSNSIDQKLTAMSIDHCFEIYELQGHVPSATSSAYYDTTLSVMSNFLSHFVCPNMPLDCDYRELLVGTDEIEMIATNVYPIPADQYIEWRASSNIDRVELYNALGQLVIFTNQNDEQIRTADLPDGIYVLRLNRDNFFEDHKILINH